MFNMIQGQLVGEDPAKRAAPLGADVVQQIRDYVESFGGSVSMGKVTTAFEGVKKSQIEQHFCLVEASASNYVVALSPELGNLALLKQDKVAPAGPKKKKKKTLDPNAPPPPHLEEGSVEQIAMVIQENGGSMMLGKLTSQFEGLKKVQLEPHFHLSQLTPHGEPIVSFSSATQLRPQQHQQRPPLASAAWPTAQAHSRFRPPGPQGQPWSGGSPMGLHAAPPFQVRPGYATQLRFVGLAPGAGLAVPTTMAADGDVEPPALAAGKAKRQRKKADPDAPPPPDLSKEVVEQIVDFVQQAGGTASLGKLTTAFEGVKKAQLEPHFSLEKVEGAGEFTVRLL